MYVIVSKPTLCCMQFVSARVGRYGGWLAIITHMRKSVCARLFYSFNHPLRVWVRDYRWLCKKKTTLHNCGKLLNKIFRTGYHSIIQKEVSWEKSNPIELYTNTLTSFIVHNGTAFMTQPAFYSWNFQPIHLYFNSIFTASHFILPEVSELPAP